jgi:hypothetical protein
VQVIIQQKRVKDRKVRLAEESICNIEMWVLSIIDGSAAMISSSVFRSTAQRANSIVPPRSGPITRYSTVVPPQVT